MIRLVNPGLMLLGLATGAFSSVVRSQESYYRIDLPGTRAIAFRSPHVLRIAGFELDSNLSSDRLLVAATPVLLRAYEFHRWVNPLDRLVQAALQLGLTRARAFAEVKGSTAGPGETLVLTGRILDSHQVTLALRLADALDHRVVFLAEFSATVPMSDEPPGAAVVARSVGTRDVLRGFLARCEAAGGFAGIARPGK